MLLDHQSKNTILWFSIFYNRFDFFAKLSFVDSLIREIHCLIIYKTIKCSASVSLFINLFI